MDISLLKEEFPDIIIQRGIDYYMDGHVTKLRETESGKFCAIVEGTRNYTVTVYMEGDDYVDLDCNCPYEGNPYCKHTAAVLLAIQDWNGNPESKEIEAARIEPPTAEALQELSKDRLVSLLLGVAAEFPDASDWLRVRLAPPKEALRYYRKRIRDAADDYEQDDYDYDEPSNATRGAETALKYLRNIIERPDFSFAFDFAYMIMEETMCIYKEYEAAEGVAEDVIEQCLDCVGDLYEKQIAPGDTKRQTAFHQRLLAVAESDFFGGFSEWNARLMRICAAIADSHPSLRESVMAYWEREMAADSEADDHYHHKRVAQNEFYELLARWRDAQSAEQFVLSHMENEDFRVLAVKIYCQRNAHGKALALCEKYEKDAKDAWNRTRRVTKWKNIRYEVYEQMRDVQAMRALGEELLLDGDAEYYDKLKRIYPADDWDEKREALLDRMEEQCAGSCAYLEIISREKDQSRILRHVQRFPWKIMDLYAELLPRYEDDVRALFERHLRDRAQQSSDRGAYRYLGVQIGVFARACGAGFALALIDEIKAAYSRKSALKQELGNAEETIRRQSYGGGYA